MSVRQRFRSRHQRSDRPVIERSDLAYLVLPPSAVPSVPPSSAGISVRPYSSPREQHASHPTVVSGRRLNARLRRPHSPLGSATGLRAPVLPVPLRSVPIPVPTSAFRSPRHTNVRLVPPASPPCINIAIRTGAHRRPSSRPRSPLPLSLPVGRRLTPACSGLAALAADARR